jgi:hypothetical protein
MERLYRAQRTRSVETRPLFVVSKTTCWNVASSRRRNLGHRHGALRVGPHILVLALTRAPHLVAIVGCDSTRACACSQEQGHRNPLAHDGPRACCTSRAHLRNRPESWTNLRKLRCGRATCRHAHASHREPRPQRREQRLGANDPRSDRWVQVRGTSPPGRR